MTGELINYPLYFGLGRRDWNALLCVKKHANNAFKYNHSYVLSQILLLIFSLVHTFVHTLVRTLQDSYTLACKLRDKTKLKSSFPKNQFARVPVCPHKSSHATYSKFYLLTLDYLGNVFTKFQDETPVSCRVSNLLFLSKFVCLGPIWIPVFQQIPTAFPCLEYWRVGLSKSLHIVQLGEAVLWLVSQMHSLKKVSRLIFPVARLNWPPQKTFVCIFKPTARNSTANYKGYNCITSAASQHFMRIFSASLRECHKLQCKCVLSNCNHAKICKTHTPRLKNISEVAKQCTSLV